MVSSAQLRKIEFYFRAVEINVVSIPQGKGTIKEVRNERVSKGLKIGTRGRR